MIFEWIRFFIVAALLIAALISFASAVFGAYRFGFVMNRMHSAGIGDTLGIFFIVTALCIASGFNMDTLKLLLLIFFMWFTSPVSTHFLGQVEYYTNPDLSKHVQRIGGMLGEEKTEDELKKKPDKEAEDGAD